MEGKKRDDHYFSQNSQNEGMLVALWFFFKFSIIQHSIPWVDKYKPRMIQHLVGMHGEKSPMNKLMAWLKGWKTWHLGEGAKIKRRQLEF